MDRLARAARMPHAICMADVAQSEAGIDEIWAQLSSAQSVTEFTQSVAAIERSAVVGDARATERCALIEAIGLGRPVNWPRALDRLQQAAEQGSASAAAQLLVLAGVPERSTPKAGEILHRAQLRRRIDAAAMLAPRPGITALEQPFVGVMEKFASAAECRWLIDAARERLGPSTIYDYATGALRGDERRTSEAAVFAFDSTDLVIEAIRARIAATMDLPLLNFEASQVLHYAPGEEFKPHHDYFDPAAKGYQEEIALRGQRVATFLIYLNDEFTGGETRFPALGFNYRGAVGDAVVFASVDPNGRPNPKTLHAGLPPRTGEKWIFSQWIREKPPLVSPSPAAPPAP